MNQQSSPEPDDYRRTPRGPAARFVAPASIGLGAMLLVLATALIGFAQVFPAIICFTLAIVIGASGTAAAFTKRISQPESDAPYDSTAHDESPGEAPEVEQDEPSTQKPIERSDHSGRAAP